MDDNSQEIAGILRDLFRDYFDNKFLTNVNQLWDHHVSIYEKMTYIKTKQKPFIREPRDQPKWDLFCKWCNYHSIICDGVRIGKVGPEDQCQVGLIAERILPVNTAVIRLPFITLLSTKFFEDEKKHFPSSLRCIIDDRVLNAMDRNISLSMILAHEILLGESFYKPYLDVLQESYNTPLYYTIDELAKYKGTTMFEHTLRLYRSVVRVYIYYYLRLYNHNVNPDTDKFFLPGPINVNNFTFELFCWCVSTTFSRTFRLADVRTDMQDVAGSNDLLEKYPEVPFFFPFVDMANHEVEEFKPTRMQLSMSTKHVYLLTRRNYKKDEEVRMFYGLRTDWNFLVYHGFLPELKNKGNFLQLKLELPGDSKNELMKRKLRYLYKRNILPEYISLKTGRYVFAFNLMSVDPLKLTDVFIDAINEDLTLYASSSNFDHRMETEVNALLGFGSEKRDPFADSSSSSPSALVSLNDKQLRALIEDTLLYDSNRRESTMNIILKKINTSTWHDAAKALFRFALARCALTSYDLETKLYQADLQPTELLIEAKDYILEQLRIRLEFLDTGEEPETDIVEPGPSLSIKEQRKLDKLTRKKEVEDLERLAKELEGGTKEVKQVGSAKKKKPSKKSKK